MKIQGSNFAKLAAYRTQLQRQTEQSQVKDQKDKINISNEAMQLQKNKEMNQDRAERVQSIKKAFQSGEYEIDTEKTAQKMIDFWSNQSKRGN